MTADAADKLRKAVKKSKQSQNEIAKAAGISQASLNRFVRGERTLSFETAVKLANYLNVSL